MITNSGFRNGLIFGRNNERNDNDNHDGEGRVGRIMKRIKSEIEAKMLQCVLDQF